MSRWIQNAAQNAPKMTVDTGLTHIQVELHNSNSQQELLQMLHKKVCANYLHITTIMI
jgi:hypothetical protein